MAVPVIAQTADQPAQEDKAPDGTPQPANAPKKVVSKAAERKKAAREAERVDAPIVLELYTASDCSACIFADRMLYDAMQDKNVIALSCHIKDLSDMKMNRSAPRGRQEDEVEKNETEGPIDPCVFRQWTFTSGRNNRDVTINIPIFYFNGQIDVAGDSYAMFKSLLNNYHYAAANQVIEAMMQWKDKDTISIHLPASKNAIDKSNASSVWLIRYKNMDVESMETGVNKGRVLRFSNIVQNITHVGKWHGELRTLNVDVPPPQGGKEKGGYVVLVAEMLGSAYKVAGRLEDYPVNADLEEEARQRKKAEEAAEGKTQALPSNKAPEQSGPVVP